MHRGRGAGQVVDLVHLRPEGLGDIMPNEFEVGSIKEVLHHNTCGKHKTKTPLEQYHIYIVMVFVLKTSASPQMEVARFAS